MENRLEKLFLFPILCITLLFLMGLSASAADSHTGWKRVDSVSDLVYNYTPGAESQTVQPGNYYLNADISVDNYCVVSSGTVTICLHGHKLETKKKSYTFIVRGGATLNIEACGSGAGSVVNSNTSASSVAFYVAANSRLSLEGGQILCNAGDAISLNTGAVSIMACYVKGYRNGINLQAGDVTIKNGEVWGRYHYGIEINQQGYKDVSIDLNGGLITGFEGGIVATSVTAPVLTTIQDGSVEASNGGLPCINLKNQDGTLTILDGNFVGLFQSNMKGYVMGGQYTDDSIKAYVPDGYICRKTSDLYYSYEVRPKRVYTVRFTDGLGKELKTQTVIEGGSATAPPAPTRSGYIFTGWDRGFTNLSGTQYVITVNAKWKATKVPSKTTKTIADLKKVKKLQLSAAKTSITVRWKKPSSKDLKKIAYYEIRYATKKDFSDARKITVSKKKTKAVLKKLKKKTKYYIKIRTRKDSGGVIHVSKWTKKSVKTK